LCACMAMCTTLPRSATEVALGDGAAHGPFKGVYTRHLPRTAGVHFRLRPAVADPVSHRRIIVARSWQSQHCSLVDHRWRGRSDLPRLGLTRTDGLLRKPSNGRRGGLRQRSFPGP
jgi:hypothetical protein